MNIETLELIHKLLTEHKDNASRCCDRARGKRNSTPDDDQNYERYDMKLREADKAKFAAQDAESCGDPIAVAEIYKHDAEALRAALTDLIVALQRQDKKAQLWDAIFPAILQCASGDSGLHINQLYEVYMRGTKYTDDLVCSMSKLLIRAAESNVYSHDTALVRELIKILVAEVFENRENREEEE